MRDPFRNDKIQNWASEFAESEGARALAGAAGEHAQTICETFLIAACDARDINPDELREADVKQGLVQGVARLSLPPQAHGRVTLLCAAFLEDLRAKGRLGGGATLAPFVRALGISYRQHAAQAARVGGSATESDAPAPRPIVRPASKLGPNDPCPCGSGKKFKKCCKRLLG